MTPEEKTARKAAARAAVKAAEEAAKAAVDAEAAADGEDWNDPAPAAAAAPVSEFDAPVRVRCTVNTRPFTHEKALALDEEADVPPHVAEIMLKNKQVELV